jgi:glycosyltransferase involved in cell wall biosynthesis
MRILFFLESLHSGGKERRSVELIKFLTSQPDRKYTIELVLSEENIHYEEIYKTGVRIRILKRKGFRYDPSMITRFLRICHEFKPDLIHCFGKMTTFYAIPSRILTGIPLISSLIADSQKSYSGSSPYSFLLRYNVTFSDIVLANSLAGLKAYGLRMPKARVIYNGVNLARFRMIYNREAIKKEIGTGTRYIVVMVAGFSEFKDYDLLVDVAAETSLRRKDVVFLAIGDGPEWERIKQRINSENVNNLILLGRQREVEKYVSVSDIGLLCTRAEGISNSIIEYMALGKPVIVTDLSGGSIELVDNGNTGFCTERNVNSVTDLIIKLLDDPELRDNMGRKGKERIEKNFSIDRMGSEFIDLYNEVMEGKTASR